jgi:hypothetical protein
MLADQPIDWDAVDEVTPVTREAFDAVWQAHLQLYRAQLITAKEAYPLGASVEGTIAIFYPQGVIIDLGKQVLGVADHTACRASAPLEWLYTRHKVTAIVDGYDETNFWIVLAAPHVHQERIEP